MTCNRRKKRRIKDKKYGHKKPPSRVSVTVSEVVQGVGDIDLLLQQIDSIFINNQNRSDTVLNERMDGT